jgi:hypothetical protein
MDHMPVAGDLLLSWSIRPGHCFRMVYDHKLQADHCRKPVGWKGIWKDPKGRSHYVQTCGEHAPNVSQRSVGAGVT